MKRSIAALAIATTLHSLLLAQEVAQPQAASEQVQSKTSEFIRLSQSADGTPQTLDTAVASYRAEPFGVQVDLIGAVHIGEGSYYDELNKLFDQYDVLLFELVAPEGTVIEPGMRQRSSNPVSMLQDAAKNFLALESQLEKIDYTKPHFIRADMSPEQMQEKMQQRGESMFTLALSALLDALRQQNRAASQPGNNPLGDGEMDLFQMLQSPQHAKLMMAKQFAGTSSLDQALGGSLNQLLIVDRNAAALKVLKEQIEQGRKKIGIFYGAAHLPDFQEHLIADFGMKKTGTQWIKAWNLTTAGKQPAPRDPISLMLNLLKEIE